MAAEKAKLEITSTKKQGWQVVLRLDNGKQLIVHDWKPSDSTHNGKSVTLTRDSKGLLLTMILDETGDVLVDKCPVANTQSQYDQQVQGPSASQGPAKDQLPMKKHDIFQLQKTCLPDSTRLAMTGCTDIDNFHLKFYRAAHFDFFKEEGKKQESKKKFFHFHCPKKASGTQQEVFAVTPNFITTNFQAIADRALHAAHALGFNKPSGTLVSLEAKSTWRWVTGLGNASVYENGITLHHVYGIPYIPGSGVKGMLRTWIIVQCFSKDEKMAEANPVFQRIFGHPSPEGTDEGGAKGKATFFDAFPTTHPKIVPDIMNNHFQDYYEGNTPPADWLNPNPIFFMTVKDGIMRFNIGIEQGANDLKGIDTARFTNPERFRTLGQQPTLTALIYAWLKDALENHGIGAKTAVGYGRMEALQP